MKYREQSLYAGLFVWPRTCSRGKDWIKGSTDVYKVYREEVGSWNIVSSPFKLFYLFDPEPRNSAREENEKIELKGQLMYQKYLYR